MELVINFVAPKSHKHVSLKYVIARSITFVNLLYTIQQKYVINVKNTSSETFV